MKCKLCGGDCTELKMQFPIRNPVMGRTYDPPMQSFTPRVYTCNDCGALTSETKCHPSPKTKD